MAELSTAEKSFPFERFPFDPPAEYDAARSLPDLMPVRMWNGEPAWLTARMADVREVLASRDFSAMPSRAGYPFMSETLQSLLVNEEPTLTQMDGKEHIRQRRMLAPLFTPERIERLRPRVEEFVAGEIDKMLASPQPYDFYYGFAGNIPSLVISELLGVPFSDHAFFQEVAQARMDLSAGPDKPVELGRQLGEYLERRIRQRLETGVEGEDDVVAALIRDQIIPGNLPVEEAAAICRNLLVAGHETTANVIAFGLLILLLHPEQMEEVRRSPELVPAAVEEILRYATVSHVNSARVALVDVEVGGQLIRAGEGVLAMIAAANRDPEAFDDPARFNIHRASDEDHVAFAFGIHVCLGQHLARLELQTVFRMLLERVPTVALAESADTLTYRYDKRTYGVEHLPLTW